jgi:hypothetical protein
MGFHSQYVSWDRKVDTVRVSKHSAHILRPQPFNSLPCLWTPRYSSSVALGLRYRGGNIAALAASGINDLTSWRLQLGKQAQMGTEAVQVEADVTDKTDYGAIAPPAHSPHSPHSAGQTPHECSINTCLTVDFNPFPGPRSSTPLDTGYHGGPRIMFCHVKIVEAAGLSSCLIYSLPLRKLFHIKRYVPSPISPAPSQFRYLSFNSVVAKKNFLAFLAAASASLSNPILDPTKRMSWGQCRDTPRCTFHPMSP